MRARPLVLALAAAPILGCGADPGPDRYTWRGTVAPGERVKVANVNGPVRVAAARGSEVVIVATRTHRGRRAEPLRLRTDRDGEGVTACVAWANSRRCGGRPGGARSLLGRLLRRYGSTEMAFTVALPAGVRLHAETVNGRVTVADAGSEVVASSVNGSVTIDAASGPVRATTVNGSVSARLDGLAPDASVALETVNGSVTALVPAAFDATVDVATTNGRITADLPGVMVGRGTRALSTVLGAGGRTLSLKTVNGGVRIGRSQ